MYVVPHRNIWKQDYEQESALIHSVCRDIELHHIGSTSIDGLNAKNCIDILGVIPNLAMISDNREIFEAIGYKARGSYGIEGREYFSKNTRKVHLHIFAEGDMNIKKHLNFVKVMRGNPKLVQALNSLKERLQNKYPNDKSQYQIEKQYFYDRINEL